MVIVWILLGLLVLVALLLAIDLRIFLVYADGTLRYRVKYGPFLIVDSEKNKKPKKVSTETVAPKKKRSGAVATLMDILGLPQLRSAANAKQAVHRDGVLTTLRSVFAELKVLFGRISRLLRSGVFRRFDLKIRVGDADAAEAALRYGQVCAVAYPMLHFTEQWIHFSDRRVEIFCDDALESTLIELNAQLNYRTFHLVRFLCGLIANYVKAERKKSNE